jgi:hypothetical protein
MPFSKEYENVEQAIKMVLCGKPFFFNVVLARDVMFESKLLESIRTHMHRAQGFVADITDLNPNVMFEVGAALIAGAGRPVFSLRGAGAKDPVPADLRAELFISYGSAIDDPVDIAAAIRKALLPGGKVHHRELRNLLDKRKKRALTAAFLHQIRYKLTEQEIANLTQAYASLEALLAADTPDVASKARMTQRNAVGLMAAISEELEEN